MIVALSQTTPEQIAGQGKVPAQPGKFRQVSVQSRLPSSDWLVSAGAFSGTDSLNLSAAAVTE
jgi:hypothetical protein